MTRRTPAALVLLMVCAVGAQAQTSQSQPAVSHHLALLRVAGLIECRRDGKHNFYHLVPKRCQAYLDVVFGVSGDQSRKVRVEDAIITYGRDGQPAP